MTLIQRRPITGQFVHFLSQSKIILTVWAKYIAVTFLASLIFGPVGPMILSAFLFTLGLPVVLLTLWGMSLDQELQWGETDEGPR